MTILSVYREPFAFQPHVARLPEGLSLDDLWRRMPNLPPEFARIGGMICINGQPIPCGVWVLVRPKPTCRGVPVQVSFHLPIHGGGDDGGKSGIATIGALALLLLSGGAAGGMFATAGGLFTQASISANLLSAGISLAGSLLLNSLAAPPVRQRDQDTTNRSASIEANVLEPNGVIPRVLGERRVYPNLLAQPLVTLDGEDEVVEAVFGLAGPHRLKDIRVGSADIASIPGIELETREGFPGQRQLRVTRRYGVTEQVEKELRGHRVDSDQQTLLDPSIDPSVAVPQAAVMATRNGPDEHQIQIAFPQGLSRPSAEGDRIRVPLRLRIRAFGGEWRNLPELHFSGADTRLLRATIRFVWSSDPVLAEASGGGSSVAGSGWAEARAAAAGQTASPTTEDWVADDAFYAGSGDVFLWANNLGTSGVRNVSLNRYTATIRLDPAEFPPARYEIEMRRGMAMRNDDYDRDAYTVFGEVRDFFAYFGAPAQIAVSREGITDTLAIMRSVSIRNRQPVSGSDMALIAVRARNVQMDKLSVLAGGYVQDWDGEAWTGNVVTSNPAAHLRAIYAASPNLDPVPLEVIDDDTLVEWRQRCIDEGYTCNAEIRDASVFEAATIATGCGYARPYMSDIFGVVQDYDRSAEAPVMVLSPRNSRSFVEDLEYPRLPTGLRVTFDDATNDWTPRQITVWRDGNAGDTSRTEQVRLEGIDTEAAAIAMARYMLSVPALRRASYGLDVPPSAALICRSGSLVAVTSDSLSAHHGFGRVIAGGQDEIELDTSVRLINEPEVHAVTDIHDVPDVWLLGQRSAAAIQREDHTVDVALLDCVTGEDSTLIFETPQDHVSEGALVTVGPAQTQSLRLIVANITPKPGLEAHMTFIDEAPELFA